MKTSHLKEALLELQRNLRRHKASHLSKKKTDENPKERKDDSDKLPDRSGDEREAEKSSKREDSEPDTVDKETREKMKDFFSKRNTGAAKDRFVFGDSPRQAPPAPKPKGRTKA